MPLFAALIGKIASGFAALLGVLFELRLALKYSAYLTWIVVFTTFLGTVFVCTSLLYSSLVAMLGTGGGVNAGLLAALSMGVGMLIPANAGGVIGCVASVWIATNIYKVQKQGLFNFSS